MYFPRVFLKDRAARAILDKIQSWYLLITPESQVGFSIWLISKVGPKTEAVEVCALISAEYLISSN